MGKYYPDTHPDMESLQIELIRQVSPARKMRMVADLNATVQLMALAGLRLRHPGADEGEIRRRLPDLLLGEELASQVYGPANYAG